MTRESTVDGQDILVPPASDDEFRAACAPSLKSFADKASIVYEFKTSQDSTDVTVEDWVWLTKRIYQAQQEGFDGVAITHGTDTLCHTANALSLALSGTRPDYMPAQTIPVVLTGSQNSIYLSGGDGRFNLENLFRTLLAAIEHHSSDVLISFFDRVILGTRALKMTESRFDAIDSPTFPRLAWIDAHGVHLRQELLRNGKMPFKTERNEIAPAWGTGVVVLKLNPGLEPAVIEHIISSGRVRALILECLGEGNVPNANPAFDLAPVIKSATDRSIPVFMTSQYPHGRIICRNYKGGAAAVEAGGIPCGDHTSTAIYVKVQWLLGTGLCKSIDDFRRAMDTSYAGEVTAAPVNESVPIH